MTDAAMQWSRYQERIFEAVESDQDSIMVEAVAGSGKTTTLVEIINRIPRSKKVLFCAFNVAIAKELKRRVDAERAECRTLHSLGNAAWREALGWDGAAVEVNGRKVQDIVYKQVQYQDRMRFTELAKLVGLAKGAGIVPRERVGRTVEMGEGARVGPFREMTEDCKEEWTQLIEFYELDSFKNDSGDIVERGIELARAVLATSIEQATEVIDFDDQLYMPIVAGVNFPKWDVVLLDEAQDVNGIQVEIVRRSVQPSGRIIAAGDPRQAIYGFRGALSESMQYISEEFECLHYPLSVSYRCPKRVVAAAREIVPQIEEFADAAEGIVESVAQWNMTDFLPTDAILCRLNGPLVGLAFALIRARMPCRIAGRDIAGGLVALVKRMRAADMDTLVQRLQQWYTREASRAKGNPDKIGRLADKLATVNVFIDELEPGATVDQLIRSIEGMFGDAATAADGRMLTLSTVHKAKGLEWDRVFVLNRAELMPLPWAKAGWQREQEMNLLYVAMTRAKRELRFVDAETIA